MEIKLDPTKLKFKVNSKKLLQNLFDFNAGSALTEIIDKDSSKEAAAYALLYNAVRKANQEEAKRLGQDKLNATDNLVAILDEMESEWSTFFKEKVVLTKEFFDDILQFSPNYLVNSYELFTKFLDSIGIEIPESYNYVYYSVVRVKIFEEFDEVPENYQVLVDFFKNPLLESHITFDRQISHYSEIEKNYTAKLQSEVEESKETLKDLYVAPFFKVHCRNLKTEEGNNFVSPQKKTDINSFLNDFILDSKLPNNLRQKYNMIFILGQPGQGKTSLCYRLIYDLLSKTNGLPPSPLFFIKIRDLHAKDFVNDTFNTLKKAIAQNIDFDNDNCVLVLDGLDEAYMSGGLTDGDLKNLYERLNKTSKANKKLKIILTSRLNYLNIDDPSVEGSLVIKIDVLEKNQIKEYLKNFKVFYPNNNLVKEIDNILGVKRYKHIEELLQQPVLMYFIALSNIDIDETDSKANIYNKIFDSLAKRSWDNNGQLHHIKAQLRDKPEKYGKYLRKYIRNIAFEIYQSPNLHITLNQLTSLDSTKEFIKNCFNDSIASDEEAIRDVSKYLLISFYFQSSHKDKNDDAAIEFFHNSLWEYLTAEYMWEENKRILRRRDDDGDYLSVNFVEYFEVLKKLIGNKEFKLEVKQNLEDIILNENNKLKIDLFEQMKEVFSRLLDNDMLLNYDRVSENLTAKEKMQNIFEIIFTFLHGINFDLKSKIVSNSKFNEFFFASRSSLRYNQTLKNIRFKGGYLGIIQMHQSKLDNVSFNFGLLIEPFKFSRNTFTNCQMNEFCIIKTMNNNKFINSVFREVHFFAEFNIYENTFSNVIMIECQIANKDWLEKIIKHNKVDQKFIDTHEVIKKSVDSFNGKKHYNYFINYNPKIDKEITN